MQRLIRSLALAFIATGTCAQAQTYPSKTVTIVVPFAPGGATDFLARITAETLQKALGQNFVTENRTGAGGVIANTFVARAAPDGYTLLFAPTAFAIVPFTTKNVSYDSKKDLKPVSLVAYTSNVIAVTNKVKANDLKTYIADAKANGQDIVYASPGVGTPTHMGVEVFARRTGVKVRHVPYRGVAPAVIDLLSGDIQMMFMDLPAALPLIADGKIKALASLTRERHPLVPNMPTAAETVPGFYLMGWQGLFAPGGTPDDIVNKLNAPLVAYLKTPAAEERLRKLGVDATSSTPQEMRDWVNSQLDWWGKVAHDAGIQPK